MQHLTNLINMHTAIALNLAMLTANLAMLRRNRRLNLELQARSEIERRFQNWRQTRDQDRAGRAEKIAIPM
jgi:hypothetical protein